MGYTSKRLNDHEPIVLFTYEGQLTVDMFKQIIADNARYIEEIGEPIYILCDVRRLETSFIDMLHIMQEANKEAKGNASDENIKMLVFVGSNVFAQMYRNTMQKRGTSFGMTMFEDMELALEAVRTQIDIHRK
ncbi:MAG: hypothetical protein AAFV93_23155 [Chloroflexota bacterium]